MADPVPTLCQVAMPQRNQGESGEQGDAEGERRSRLGDLAAESCLVLPLVLSVREVASEAALQEPGMSWFCHCLRYLSDQAYYFLIMRTEILRQMCDKSSKDMTHAPFAFGSLCGLILNSR